MPRLWSQDIDFLRKEQEMASISLFVDCENEAELDGAITQLSRDGAVLMPPGNYGFSTKSA
jgi:hypothetical protein